MHTHTHTHTQNHTHTHNYTLTCFKMEEDKFSTIGGGTGIGAIAEPPCGEQKIVARVPDTHSPNLGLRWLGRLFVFAFTIIFTGTFLILARTFHFKSSQIM